MPTGLEGILREAQHAVLQRPCCLSRVCLKALVPIQSQKQLNTLYHPSCREKNSPPTSDLFCVNLSTSKCTEIVFTRLHTIHHHVSGLHLQTFPVVWGFCFISLLPSFPVCFGCSNFFTCLKATAQVLSMCL